MTKITLQDFSSLTDEQSAITRLNQNNTEIETKSDTFLSRDGTTPNSMAADLDMNSNRILNLPEAFQETEPIRRKEFIEAITGEGVELSLDDFVLDRDQLIEDVIEEALDDIEAIAADVIDQLNLRTPITTTTTMYVRPDGNDSNVGFTDSAAGAKLTWQGAWEDLRDNYDFNGNTVVIKQGTTGVAFPVVYTVSGSSSVIFLDKGWVGEGRLIFEGDIETPTNVILDQTGTASCVKVEGSWTGPLIFRGFHLKGTLNDVFQQSGVGNHIDIGNCRFDSHGVLSGALLAQIGPFGTIVMRNYSANPIATPISIVFAGDATSALRCDAGQMYEFTTPRYFGNRSYTQTADFRFNCTYFGFNQIWQPFDGASSVTTSVSRADFTDGSVVRLNTDPETHFPGTLPIRAAPGSCPTLGSFGLHGVGAAVAHATVGYSGATPAYGSKYNLSLSAPTAIGTGVSQHSLTFTMEDAGYPVLVTPRSAGIMGSVDTKTTTSFRVSTTNDAGTPVNADYNVVVFGNIQG
jgi:hypothetical protein